MITTMILALLAWLGFNGLIVWFCYRKGYELEEMRRFDHGDPEEEDEIQWINKLK